MANDWDHNVKGDSQDTLLYYCIILYVLRYIKLFKLRVGGTALNEVKTGKAPGLSGVLLLLLWSHRWRLKMILSSASDAHGRRTSSSKVLPRPRH